MKPICRNCHFLSKELREDNTGRVHQFSLSQTERKTAESTPDNSVAEYYSLRCSMGVWDEGVTGSTQGRHLTINLVNRASTCFFFPYNQAMLFDAARELQKRSAENQQLKRSNLYTRIGLWIAAGALVISALIAIVGYLKNNV